jgi:3-phenylpropionate/cinnamic acid dioxygenase small subunit
MMDLLSRLVAIEAIKQLKVRYARFVDTKSWESLVDVFTEDAIVRHPHLGTLRGPTDIIRAISASMGEATFGHHLGMPEIDLVGDGRARAIWSVIVHSQRSDNAGEWVDETRSEYHEDYRQGPDGHWRIASMSSVPILRTSTPVTSVDRNETAPLGGKIDAGKTD